MGTRVSEKGVTLHFMDKNGAEQSVVKGQFAFLFSHPRPIEPANSDPRLGSQDWLTDVIVVDNPAKLKDFEISDTTIAHTSTSSMSVLVRWSVGKEEGAQSGCLTISTGHPDPLTNPNDFVYVEDIRVLPSDTQMNDKHPLWKLWKQMGISFFTQLNVKDK
jgi:hypothetical protein